MVHDDPVTEQPATVPAPARSLVHHADFRRLWMGDTASQLGVAIGSIAVPYLAVTTLNTTEFQMGLLGTLTSLGFLLIGLPSGALVDRMHKRRVMIHADLGRALLLATLPLAFWLGWLTFAQVLVVATAAGMLTVFFDVSYQSYLPFLVPRDQVVEGNSKLQASQSVSQLVGPGIGGLLIKLVGPAWVIVLNAVGYLSSAFALGRIEHRETPPTPEERRPLVTEIREGLSFVVRHPLLRKLIACTAIGNLAYSAVNALSILYMVDTLHFSAFTIGVLESIGAAGGLVGALFTTKLAKAIGEGPTILLTATCFQLVAFAWPLSAVLDPKATLGIGFVLISASVVSYNIATVSFRQRLCPPALLGRMNASARFLVWGTMPIGSFIGGVLGTKVGLVPTLWIASIFGLLSLLPIYFSPLWRMHTLPDPEDQPAVPVLETEEDRPTVPEA